MWIGFAPKRLSAYTNQDSDANVILKDHTYLAGNDGFVTAYANITTGTYIRGYVGVTDDPVGAGDLILETSVSGNDRASISFPVAAGEYFEITTNAAIAINIRWKSNGRLSKPVDQD